MIVIRNKFIPFGNYKAMNLFGIVFVKKGAKFTEEDYNHEKIHLKQMQEMLWIFFYLWYGIEYLVIRILSDCDTQTGRYHDVSFEEEAHKNDKNLEYLKTRKHYTWFKYVKIGSSKK